MSALGEYVHLKAANYSAYGINRNIMGPKTTPYHFLLGFKNQVKQEILSSAEDINQSELDKISKHFNQWTDIQGKMLDDSDVKRLQDTVVDAMIKKYGKRTEFDWEAGNVTVNQKIKNNNIKKQNIKSRKTKGHASADRIIADYKKLKERFDEMKNLFNVRDQNTLQRWFNNVSTLITTLETEANNFRANIQSSGKSTFEFQTDINQFLNISTSNGNGKIILDNLNKISAKLALPALPQALQDFQEYQGYIVEQLALNVGIEDIIKSIAKGVKSSGANPTTTTLRVTDDLSHLSNEIVQEVGEDLFLQNPDGTWKLFTEYKSQQKADMIFTFQSPDNPLKEVGISLKNYNLSNNPFIHLVSGSPLLTFLIGMGNTERATHILNILAEHEDDNYFYFQKVRKIGLQGLAYYILAAAATGRGVGRAGGFAEIIGLNDRTSKGGTVFYSIRTLLKNIAKIGDPGLKLINIEPKLDSIKLTNDKVDINNKSLNMLRQIRIVRLIAETHAVKISASLKASAFQLR